MGVSFFHYLRFIRRAKGSAIHSPKYLEIMGKCSCPLPTAISTINIDNCPFDLKQLQKIFFQRRGYVWDDGITSDITLKADWDALVVAADDTKVAVSPLIGGDPIITAGEAITEGGGDNSTLNGVELVTGTNPSVFTAIFKSLTPDEEAALKTFICEGSLGVYFANEDQDIIAQKLSPTTQTSIPVQSLFFGDRDNQGFGTKDTFAIQFSLPAGWSENIAKYTPADFNPLIDLDQ